MKNRDFDLMSAFPETPAACRDALMHAARSVKEEPMKRKYPVAILVAAILTLMSTIAIAEGWNVLSFLDFQPDNDAQTLVQPVSVSASVDNCTLRIDSAITDGEYLAFDWTVTNTKPETPIYLVVEKFTANGENIRTDGTDDFNCQWLPGLIPQPFWQDGNLSVLPDSITGDTLHVEMVVGVYTPSLPVFYMEVFDPDLARKKIEEGYYVIPEGEGFVIELPEEGLVHAVGEVSDRTNEGLNRSEMVIRFDLNLKDGRATCRKLDLPAPVTKDSATLALTRLSTSPLQTRFIATLTPEKADYDAIVNWAKSGSFVLCDTEGNELNLWDYCANQQYECTVEEAADGSWYLRYDHTLFGVAPALPDELLLSFIITDGSRIDLPIILK